MKTTEFDSPKWREKRDSLLREWMLGNEDAVEFLLTVFQAAELWDDIIDGDHQKAKEAVSTTMLALLIDLPANKFFCENLNTLRTGMLLGINAWKDSVLLEQRSDNWAKTWAYALRDLYMELVPLCAMLVGGYHHMRAISLPAREFFQAETFGEYLDGRSD